MRKIYLSNLEEFICLCQHFVGKISNFQIFAYVSNFLKKKNQLRKSIFGFFKHNRNMGFGSYFDQKIFNFEVLWRLKNRKKTGLFVNYTHITVRLILYLGITTRLLRYYTLNSVKQLFRKLFFFILKNAVEA